MTVKTTAGLSCEIRSLGSARPNVSFINGFVPDAGNTYRVMTFGSRSGTFATINGLDLGGGRLFQVNLTATSLTLVTPP